jgi:ketosteroid isomerase-like protein
MRLMLLFALSIIAGCAKAPPAAGTAQRDLLAANAAYDQALIRGDAVALDRFYTDDFQIIDDDAEMHNKAAQIRFMTQQVDLLEAKTDDVRVTMLAPDSALLTGRFKGRYRLDGKESDFTERYTSVWVRDGSDWRLRHEHSSIVPQESDAEEQ